MKNLQDILFENLTPGPQIDGHVHMFSHRGVISDELKSQLPPIKIGFADIELDALDQYKDMPGLYKKYASLKNAYYLATGLNIEQVEQVYDVLKNGSGCFGFGELKLYDEFNGKEINMKKISFAYDVCKFSSEVGNLPVYIHYELNNTRESNAFEKLLIQFPDIPIVLCHCGMNETNSDFAWGQCVRLSNTYSNCWIDVSWDAAKYISKSPLIIFQLPLDRVIWGSDVSPRLEQHGFKSMSMNEILKYQKIITRYCNSDRNLRNLFCVHI